MKRLSALRFFARVASPARPLVAVLAILVAAAAVLEAVQAGSSDWVLASIALIQLFAVSTGFTPRATRGHFDPVLLLPGGRPRLVLAHFAVSSAPGVAAWILVGAVQGATAGTLDTPAFRPAGWTTLLLVSSVAWALGVRAPAFAGGALYLLSSVALLFAGKTFRVITSMHIDARWAAEHPGQAVLAALSLPYMIPFLRWPPSLLLAFLLLAAAAIALGVALIARAEFPLAEEGG